MSELYNHLKRLQGKPQRILEEGVPFPVPQGPGEGSSRARRSKRVLLAVPITCVVLGLLTIAAVVAVRKFSEDLAVAKSQKIARVPKADPESHPQASERQQKDPAEPSVGSRLGVPEATDAPGKGRAASEGVRGEPDSPNKDTASMMGTGSSSNGPGSSQTPLVEKAAEPPVKASETKMATSDSATGTPLADSPPSALQALSENPLVGESGRDAAGSSAVPGDALRAGRKSPLRSKQGAAAKSSKKESSPMDGAGDASRHVLVIAEEARRMGNWEEAVRGYREYLAQKSDPSVMNNLGAVLLAQGRFAEAEQVLAQAYNRSSDPDIGANLAFAYWFQGKKEAACLLLFSLQENSSAAGALESLGPMRHQCRRDR